MNKIKILKRNIPMCTVAGCGSAVNEGRCRHDRPHRLSSDSTYKKLRFQGFEIIEEFKIQSITYDTIVTNFGNIRLDSNGKMNINFQGAEADVFGWHSHILIGASSKAKSCILNGLANRINGLNYQVEEKIKIFNLNIYETDILGRDRLVLTHDELSQFIFDITGKDVQFIKELPLEAITDIFELWKFCNSLMVYKMKLEKFMYLLRGYIISI